MVNPVDGNHHGVPKPFCIDSDEYREEAEALVRVAMDVERGIWPAWYLEYCDVDPVLSPILEAAGGLTMESPQDCANAVRMDQPAELWNALAMYAADEGIRVRPELKGIRFLETFVDPLHMFGPLVSERMHKAFEVKYYYGLARPEEYFEAPNFAHYEEGCPNHPAYIAGHGTVGGCAYACFKDSYPNARSKHLEAVETATKQFSHFRDFARVHTRQDSAMGWRFGAGEFG